MSDRILICGDEPSLLETRSMVLVRAGFDVVSTCTRREIAALPEEPEFGLAVIGQTLVEREKRLVVEDVRRRWPEISILFLTDRSIALEPPAVKEYRASSLPPHEFVVNCRQILEAGTRVGSGAFVLKEGSDQPA